MSLFDFNPNFKSSHVAPHAGNDGTTDFPMDDIIARLDGENATIRPDTSEINVEAVLALAAFSNWLFEPIQSNDMRGVKAVGIRALAARWVLTPEKLGGLSAFKTAEAWGLHQSTLTRYTSEFSARFKIKNVFQAHDWRSKN